MADFDDLLKKVSDGISRAGETAKNVTNYTVNKVGKMTREAKIRYAMNETEEKMQQNYTLIGECVYNSYKTGDRGKDFSEYIGRLDALNEEMEDLKRQLKKECHLLVCHKCNKPVKKGNAYCPKCGARIRNEYI